MGERVRFDPTINISQILMAGGFVISLFWSSLSIVRSFDRLKTTVGFLAEAVKELSVKVQAVDSRLTRLETIEEVSIGHGEQSSR